MFQTSVLYKEAISRNVRTSFVDGVIVTKSGKTIPIHNESMTEGSIYVTNQCVNDDSFEYGTVFSAETGITLKTEVDRYSLYDAELKMNYNLRLSDGSYESIPLGMFYVNEPLRTGKSISIKAYDRMTWLNRRVEAGSTGDVFAILSLLAEKCGVELAQTQEEINNLTNGLATITVDVDKVETYRDLLAYICLITCTFACFDRYGKLKLYRYGMEPVKTIRGRGRHAASFSDFETYYSSASARFITMQAYKDYACGDEGKGLYYNLGEIPIIQGSAGKNQEILDNIFKELKTVKYVPCQLDIRGDPSMELGDVITNIDQKGNEIRSIITFYKWVYRGRHQIRSAGKNPKAKEVLNKERRELASLESKVQAQNVTVYPYTNAKEYCIQGNGEKTMKEIIRIPFNVVEDTTALFTASIPFHADAEGMAEFRVRDGEYGNRAYAQRCHEGSNFVTLSDYVSCAKNTTRKITVIAGTSGAGQAPVVQIDKLAIRAVVFGQGMLGRPEWDGTIEIDERMEAVLIPEANSVTELWEGISFKIQAPCESGVTQSFVAAEIDAGMTFP